MQNDVTDNEYPKDTLGRRSQLKAEDIEQMVRDLSQIVKRDDWKEAGRDYVLKNCVGDIPWSLGNGLFWILAEEHYKSKGLYLPWDEFVEVVTTMGVKKSFAFECKRAAYVVLSMMMEPEIWKVFCDEYLSKTALYKLSLLKNHVKKYWKSEKMDLDKEKLLSEIERVHIVSRNQLFLEEGKGIRHTFHGKITRLGKNEVTIVFPNKNGMEKNRSQVIGSSAIVAFTVKKKKRKKKDTTSRKREGKDAREKDSGQEHTLDTGEPGSIMKIKSFLNDALAWLVGRIKVMLHLAH
jgi:hypothetical protein